MKCPDCEKELSVSYSAQRGWVDVYVCPCGCRIEVSHNINYQPNASVGVKKSNGA